MLSYLFYYIFILVFTQFLSNKGIFYANPVSNNNTITYGRETMTIKFVGVSGKNGRERQIITIPAGMTVINQVARHFGIDWSTARAALQRGYVIVDYHKRSTCPGPVDDPGPLYQMCWFIFHRKFKDRLPWYIDVQDLVQEGVLRLVEMAGHPRFGERKFRFYLAFTAMKGFVEREQRRRRGFDGTFPDDDESLIEADGYFFPRVSERTPDTWGMSQRATIKMCRLLEGKDSLTQPRGPITP